MIDLLTDIVLTTAGFLLILLGIVVLKQKGEGRLTRILLVAFLLSKASLMIRWFLFRFDILPYDPFRLLYYVSGATFFVLAPLLYLHIRTLCYKDFPLSGKTLLHVLPFAGMVLFSAVRVQVETLQATAAPPWLHTLTFSHYWRVFWTANFIQIFFYIAAMLKTVHGYRKTIQDRYSSAERINLNWLVSLLVVIILHWSFVVTRSMLSLLHASVGNLPSLIDLFSITIFLVFTTILVLKGLGQLKVFGGIEEKPKYSNARLLPPELTRFRQKLALYMETNKPYLTPSLTIDDLSETLAIPTWQLSQVINASFRQNFFNFVNSYRIEEAKRLMLDPFYSKWTILEILYEVGFNSKSTFNDVFKKQTGMTPSDYRRTNHTAMEPSALSVQTP